MVDALFSDPRLAALHDDFDGARDDLDHYQGIVRELDAQHVLDVGCGSLPPLQVDLALMTGNVAQVFLTDRDLSTTLLGIHAALRPGGHLVLESRRPEHRAWKEWQEDPDEATVHVAGVGPVAHRRDVTSVELPLVSFRHTYASADGTRLVSDSTLRFRSRAELHGSLSRAGFTVREVRDAPDRPGREYVFIAET